MNTEEEITPADDVECQRGPAASGNCDKDGAWFSNSRVDLIFFGLVAVFGLFAVLFHERTADFMGEDAFYADAAQSMLHHGFYGVNGVAETTQPPGLAGILAGLFAVFGYSHSIAGIAMSVFETLGFLIVYVLLRRRIPRLVAAAICILLLSSPTYFSWATRLVYACFPYFFTTMAALLSYEDYDKATNWRSRVFWGAALTASVAASLLIATGTVALLGALVAVIAFSALQDRRLACTRLLKLLPVLLVGTIVVGLWTNRKPAPLEWSLPGYPASYLNQLKVKNGNYPELGMAKWSDIPERLATNVLAESDNLAAIVLRHGVNRTKVAVVILPVLLILIGWIGSVWKSKGTDLVDWYFGGYQFIYLLWPWNMDPRFLLPVAPLACLYLWRGGSAAITAVRTKPRVVGIIWTPVGLLLSVSGTRWLYTHWNTGYGDLPDELLIPILWASVGCAGWMAYTGQTIGPMDAASKVGRWVRLPLGRSRIVPLQLLRFGAYVIVIGMLLIGVAVEVRIARENHLTTSLEDNAEKTGVSDFMPSEVEAGIWLRSHTPPEAVVMARHWPTVHHFAERKLVWFPPLSDPNVLFQGIAKYGVNYVVVVNHPHPYYLPDDEVCFDPLLAAHPGDFRLVFEKLNLRIFRIEMNLHYSSPAPQL